MLLYITLQFLLCFDSLGCKDRCANINFLTYLLTYWLGVRKSARPVKMSDEVLVWLSVCREVQIVCIHHPLTLYSRLKPSFFLQILPTVHFPFFFGTDSTDSPDCSAILCISVFTFYFFFSTFLVWFRAVDYADLCQLLSASRISHIVQDITNHFIIGWRAHPMQFPRSSAMKDIEMFKIVAEIIYSLKISRFISDSIGRIVGAKRVKF